MIRALASIHYALISSRQSTIFQIRFAQHRSLTSFSSTISSDEECSDDELVRPAELPGDRNDDMGILKLEPDESAYRTNVKKLWQIVSKAIPQQKYNVVEMIKSWQTEEGHRCERKDLTTLITRLRRRGRYVQALQISDWMAIEKPCKTGVRDHMTRLYLASRCGKFSEAEHLLAELDFGFHGEMTYTFLLSGYTAKLEVKRAELLWRRMKEKEFVKTAQPYNNMLIMYKRKKLHGQLRRLYVEMILSRIPPDATTYLILLTSREEIGGFDGIEKKAERAMGSLEMVVKLNGATMETMMRVYGYLGELEGVERMWKRLKQLVPRSSLLQSTSLFCAIEAFGLAGGIKQAEEVFERMKTENMHAELQKYYAMIDVYCGAGLVEKAEELLRKAISEGHDPSGAAFSSIIKAQVVKMKRVDKAEELLGSALGRCRATKKHWLESAIVCLMEEHARRGDVAAAERVVLRCRENKYFLQPKLYNMLLRVYLNARAPPGAAEESLRKHPLAADAETCELLLKQASGLKR